MPVEAVASALATGPSGIALAEARARLDRYGRNVLEEMASTSWLSVLLHQFRSPVIYILVLATGVTVVIGEYVDSAVIAAVLTLNASIGFFQERRAEASVLALMQLVSPRARVVREGRDYDIASKDLVLGDVVLLESGVKVPADLRLATGSSLAIDESLLTGESVPAQKNADEPVDEGSAVADRPNMAWAGSVVARGRGRGYVVATGMATELGAIAAHMRTERLPETPLQRRMARLASMIGVGVGVAAVSGFALGVALGEGPSAMFTVAVALAVAAIPEGLPVAFTITLARGVRRMARRNAIIRRLPAVETLGSTTVIGSDKTGTLTENRMTVRALWADGAAYRVQGDALERADGAGAPFLPESRPLYLTVLAGVLANESTLHRVGEEFETQGDPTETALLVAAAHLGVEPGEAREAYAVDELLAFESERQYSACVARRSGRRVLFVKGAPERIAGMCSSALSEAGSVGFDPDAVQQAAGDMAGQGLRVLAMAYREFDTDHSNGQPALAHPRGLTFLGMAGMLDPPRAGVREAIAGCRDAGIRVVMITGDHAVTAAAIARELGIAGSDRDVVTGAELEGADDERFEALTRQNAVFARAAPEHKLRIVRSLQGQGHVVAITGDGVNDAPALRAADIGIAMGRGGTDVAREAADMVLADDNFVSIHAAVEEGRITFDNVRKVTFFLLSTGVASIVAILVAVALQWPLPMVAAQLLWLNLVTNGLQDIALAFEPGEKGVLKRAPRRRDEGVISRLLWERTFIAGLVMGAGTLALFRWELDNGATTQQAQTVALTTMVLFQMFHVGNSRSEHVSAFARSPLSNPFLFAATLAAAAVHVGALYLPPTQFVLRVEPLALDSWLRIIAVAASVLVAGEAHKLLRGPRRGAEPAVAPA